MLDWDRTHDWVLQRFSSDRAELMVLFEASQPSLRELMALRQCLPSFKDIPPAAARAQAGSSGQLELGELPGPEARRLQSKLQRVGVRSEVRVTSRVSYTPLDRTTGLAWLIEDEADAARIAVQMIQAGVPVEDTTE